MNDVILPVTAVIPTRNRYGSLNATLESLSKQSKQPAEIVIVDSSDGTETKNLSTSKVPGLQSKIVYAKAASRGAASQRNEGVLLAKNNLILFLDDDLFFEEKCIERLYDGLLADQKIGGVNAMITNQKYSPPGFVSRLLFRFLNDGKLDSYAGKCLGPVMNLLPEDRDNLPEVVLVEWLNTTCTLYRKEAMPNPPFPAFFTGYSMFEDVTISMTVGKSYKLANVRVARVFHDSQPGDHKKSLFVLSKMEIVNRYYVMTRVLGRNGFRNFLKFFVTEIYKVSSNFQSIEGIKNLPSIITGKISGVWQIIKM